MKDITRAFPTPRSNHEYGHEGMTIRDYFAIRILQGELMANGGSVEGEELERLQLISKMAYEMADIMLAAR